MKNGLFCVSYKGQVKDEIGRPRHMFKVEIEKRSCSDFFFALSPKGYGKQGLPEPGQGPEGRHRAHRNEQNSR